MTIPTKRKYNTHGRNAWYRSLTPTEQKVYWRGYEKGHTAGSKRDTVTKLETEISNLKQKINQIKKEV